MSDEEIDHLLQIIPDLSDDEGLFDDGELLGLGPDENPQLEVRLARSAEARSLLRELRMEASEATVAAGSSAFDRSSRGYGPTLLRRLVIVAGCAAAAVALLVWGPWTATPEPMVAYNFEGPSGFVQASRGRVDEDTALYVAESRLRLIARPEAVASGLTLRVFAAQASRVKEAPSEAIEVGENGAARLELRAGDLFDREGDWEIHALVVRADEFSPVRSLDELMAIDAVAKILTQVRYQETAAPPREESP
ncbi:MAG: hypothetical protein AAGF12_27700 [Myxococcota bacterium]